MTNVDSNRQITLSNTEISHLKRCSKCKQLVDRSNFYEDKRLKIGLKSQCKDCEKKYAQRPEVKKRATEHMRERYKRPDVKAKKKKYMQKYRQRPEVKKRRAEKARERHSHPDVKAKQEEWAKKYRQRPEVKERRKSYLEEYYQRPDIKAQLKAYHQHPEVKTRNNARLRKRYEKPEVKTRIRKQKAKHRQLGYIELWPNPFPEDINVDFHHIFQGIPFVVPIPKTTHNFVGGNASNDTHWSFNKQWINDLYQMDIDSLILDEGGCVISC